MRLPLRFPPDILFDWIERKLHERWPAWAPRRHRIRFLDAAADWAWNAYVLLMSVVGWLFIAVEVRRWWLCLCS